MGRGDPPVSRYQILKKYKSQMVFLVSNVIIAKKY